jgi:hypothetical protein
MAAGFEAIDSARGAGMSKGARRLAIVAAPDVTSFARSLKARDPRRFGGILLQR